MDESYRGFLIRLELTGSWRAVIVELATGATLPTMATALAAEGRVAALKRARSLVDLYAGALEARALRA